MCGILALYARKRETLPAQDRFAEMLGELGKRGPDGRQIFQARNVILGHTRLSIIDLKTGTQPIFNEDRSVACILNGEIYNFIKLRERLLKQGHHFATASDTEVIVHLYEEEGEEVFKHLSGMFSIVLYDARRELLLVGRDRMGEKPLLYYDSPQAFWCASELKALVKNPNIPAEIDLDAVVAYLNLSYIPAPRSIYKRILKLEPAHYLKITQEKTEKISYWSPEVSIDRTLTEGEICKQIVEILNDSVRNKMMSDVPIGVFLSGGIDSSAVVAFMASNSKRPIKTFSVGFDVQTNELPYARQVAERYQTDHTEIFVQSNIRDVLPEVARYYDEPFADNSNVPTYLISKAAREHVKVVLTGDGGDELFAGYGRYLTQRYYANSRILSKGIRVLNRLEMKTLDTGWIDRFYRYQSNLGAAEHWLSIVELFSAQQLKRLCRFPFGWPHTFDRRHHWLQFDASDPLSEAYAHDFNYYLPDDLLKKVDMASMAFGLESRAPFLDHRLIELSLRIPPELKIKRNETKYLLKKSLAGLLPESILNREKQGFGAPVGAWIRTDIREIVHDALSPGCKIEDLFFRDEIRAVMDWVYAEDSVGDWRTEHHLWCLLMLELWMKVYR